LFFCLSYFYSILTFHRNAHFLRNQGVLRVRNVQAPLPAGRESIPFAQRAGIAFDKDLALFARFLFAHLFDTPQLWVI